MVQTSRKERSRNMAYSSIFSLKLEREIQKRASAGKRERDLRSLHSLKVNHLSSFSP